MPSSHFLGLRGQFALESHLQDIASKHGLSINRIGSGVYTLDGDMDLDALCPSFVARDGNQFDAKNMSLLLNFIHQPIRASLAQVTDKKQTHTQRVTVHHLLRFMQSGSVAIPIEENEELEKETAECHAKTEQAMRDEDAWALHPEIGNSDVAISSLPETGLDVENGFSFSTYTYDYKRGAQRQLNESFWSQINLVTQGRYKNRPETLHLSGEEMNQFCFLMEKDHIASLVKKVQFEEEFQAKEQSIKQRLVKLSIDPKPSRSPAETLKTLMQCSSALTPVIASEEMRQLWTRYHFTERNASPLDGIQQEFEVMHALMSEYAKRDNLTSAHVEAITHEFYPLLAFTKEMAKLLDQDRIKDALEDQGIALSSDFMPQDYQDILGDLEAAAGQGRSTVKHIAEAGWDTTLDFTMDVVNFIRESPKTAAVFVALASTLYVMNGGDAETTQAANDAIMVFGENGLQEIAVDMDSLPEQAKTSQNWHWDMGPLGLYKHYMYDNAVVGPAQTMLDWVRMGFHGAYEKMGLPINLEPSFSKAASATTEPLADQLFKVNLFQNFSHAAFWMYMASRGFNHGLKGGKRIFELLSPLTDLGYQGLMKTKDMMAFKKKAHLAETLAGKVDQKISESTQTLHALAEAAQIRGMDALENFDYVLEHIADQIGIDEPWYQKFLQEKVRDVMIALEQYHIDKNEKALQTVLDEALEDIVGAEIRHTGQSNIHTDLIGELDEKSQARLCDKANAQFGKMNRANILANTNSLATKAGTHIWGGMVNAARATKRFGSVATQKPVLIAAAGTIAACVGMDMAGYGNELTDTLSAAAGGLSSTGITTSTFLVYNFVEDVLGVHVGSGAALLASGAAAGYIYRKSLKPINASAVEMLRADIV